MFEQLGPALRILREQAGLGQSQAAALAGVSKSQLSKYETGRDLPKLDTLARLLQVLDVRPLWLFYLADLLGRSRTGEALPPEAFLQAGPNPFLAPVEEAAFRGLFDQLLSLYRHSVEARATAARPRTAAS